MKISGTSRVNLERPVMDAIIEELLSNAPKGVNLDSLEIKFDGRQNVKSYYGRYVKDKNFIIIYTGAIVATWEDMFSTSDGMKDTLDVFITTLVFLMKKLFKQEGFDFPVKVLKDVKVSEDWKSARDKALPTIRETYEKTIKESPEITLKK